MKRSHWKWLWISLTFSTIVLIAVLYFTIDERTFEYLRRLNPIFLILAFVLHIVSIGIWAMRVQKMADNLGYFVPYRHCFNLILANLFVGAITPAQAGGEPIRIHQLYRANVPIGDATAIVIMERIFDAIVLGFTGAIVILLLGERFGSSTSPSMVALYVSWSGMIGLILLFIYSIRYPDPFKRIVKKLFGWLFKKLGGKRFEPIIGKIDREVENFHGSLCYFVKHGKRGLMGWPFILSGLFWISEFFTASLILMGLGEPPYIVESFIAQIILAIIMMIPITPGGSGIAELGATSLYRLFVNPSIVGIFVVLWRAIFYYFHLIVGFLAGLVIIKREATVVQVD